MEAAILYYLGAKFHVQALGIMTVSDHMVTGERNNFRGNVRNTALKMMYVVETLIAK